MKKKPPMVITITLTDKPNDLTDIQIDTVGWLDPNEDEVKRYSGNKNNFDKITAVNSIHDVPFDMVEDSLHEAIKLYFETGFEPGA